jgi:hypothetical protein
MSTALRTYIRGAETVLMRDDVAGTNRYYHFDHQGTTQALSDSTGAVTDRFASDAWGVQLRRTGTSGNPLSVKSEVVQLVRTAVLPRDDVFYVETDGRKNPDWNLAVLAASCGTSANRSPCRGVHQPAVGTCRTRRAFNWRIASTSMVRT